jgi:hypothetical protein
MEKYMTESQEDEYLSIQVKAVKIEPFRTPTKVPPTISLIKADQDQEDKEEQEEPEEQEDQEDQEEQETITEDQEEINENDIDENDIDDGEINAEDGLTTPEELVDEQEPEQEAQENPLLTKSCGVIYLAYGRKYIQEAVKSARSFKKFHQKIPISVYTDQIAMAVRYPTLFSKVVKLDPAKKGFKVAAYAKLEKIKAMRDSPYEVTLYLDCDTVVLQPIGELFKKVSEHDMLIANSPHLDTTTKPYKLVAFAKPKAYNSGVIVYQRNERTARLFKEWLSLSAQDKNTLMKVRENFYDQPKLVKLLNSPTCQIKLKIIPNVIYNARHTMIPRLKKQHLYSKVKIIHTHDP